MSTRAAMYLFLYGIAPPLALIISYLTEGPVVVGEIIGIAIFLIALPYAVKFAEKRFPPLKLWLDGPLIVTPPPPPPPPPPPLPPTYDDFLQRVEATYQGRCRSDGLTPTPLMPHLQPVVKYIYDSNPHQDHAAVIAVEMLLVFSYYAPPTAKHPIANLPLYETIPVKNAIAHLVGIFFKDEAKPLDALRHQLNTNRSIISERVLGPREWSRGTRIPANEYPGTNQETVDSYLTDTPLKEIFYTQVPFGLEDEVRFEHQWITGNTGTGKTTFLSAMIERDLDRVARGECCVIVMDSQNKLVPNIAHLKRFAPGGDLHGQLIYIEPDEDNPVAVNVFDTQGAEPSEMLNRSAATFISFFLRSGMHADTTQNMDTALGYLIPATMALPDATVFTLEDILNGKFDKVRFLSLDDRVQRWLTERIGLKKEGTYKATFDALRGRLDRFGNDKLFRRMFETPRSRLDFAKEISKPQVILINTNEAVLQQTTKPFGRFFMASIFFAAQKRLLATTAPIPTFFYIDEATDYISEDRTTIDIIDKARKLELGLILSTQSESRIDNPAVLAAVRRTAIHTKTVHPRGSVSISQRGYPPQHVEFQDRQFKDMLHMRDAEWEGILKDMRKRFSPDQSEVPNSPRDPGSRW